MMVANAAMARPPMKKCWRKEVRMDIGNGVLVVDVRSIQGMVVVLCKLCKLFIKMYPYTIFYTFEHTLFGSQYTVHATMRFRTYPKKESMVNCLLI